MTDALLIEVQGEPYCVHLVCLRVLNLTYASSGGESRMES